MLGYRAGNTVLAVTEHARIRVVLADPRLSILQIATPVLEAADDLVVSAVATDLASAVARCQEHDAQVLIVDLHMLGESSRRGIRELRRQLPGTALIILTMEATPAFVPAVIGAGASAYVLKEFAETELVPAVREVACGHHFVSAQLAD